MHLTDQYFPGYTIYENCWRTDNISNEQNKSMPPWIFIHPSMRPKSANIRSHMETTDQINSIQRVFGARGVDGNWRPSLRRVRLTSPKALSLAIVGGVWGRAPATNAFGTWEQLGMNGTHFWLALTPFSIFRVRQASVEGALPLSLAIDVADDLVIPIYTLVQFHNLKNNIFSV